MTADAARGTARRTHAADGSDSSRRPHAVHDVASRIRIGRAADNDLVIDDLQVSSHHAELLARGPHDVEIVDLRSHFGTFVNGTQVTREHIGDLDLVAIGRHHFRLVDGRLEEYIDNGEVTFTADGLTVVRRGQTLLQNVSFALNSRELLAIVGPSGCGKSTLLKALTGAQPATSGTVRYNDRDLYTHYEEVRARLGYVPQEDILHVDLTVHEALSYGAQLRFAGDVSADEREQRIEEVLDELGLSSRRGALVKHLSGGERKRVSVGLELLTKPSVLFLDEPTSGLDPGHERELTQLFAALAAENRTVVLVTHSVDSMRVCDQSLFLAPGGHLAYAGIPLLAPSYFGRDDFVGVFQRLATETDVDWVSALQQHQAPPDDATPATAGDEHRRTGEAAVPSPAEEAPAPSAPAVRAARPGVVAQAVILGRRYLRLLRASDLKLMLLQAPVLGLLMLVALPAHELAPPAAGMLRLVSRAPLVLLVVVLAATWIGASNAAQEVVKELPVLRRERAAGLSLPAYLASKVLVLGSVTVVQTVVLVLIATARQGSPVSASALESPRLEIVVAGVAASLSGMALGLLVSAVAGTRDRAVTILPVVLIVEMLLAMGGIFPDVVDHPVLKQATYAASTSWAFDAAESTADVNRLQALASVVHDVDTTSLAQTPLLGDLARPDPIAEQAVASLLNPGNDRLRHDPATWWEDIGVVLALAALMIAMAGAALVIQTTPGRES